MFNEKIWTLSYRLCFFACSRYRPSQKGKKENPIVYQILKGDQELHEDMDKDNHNDRVGDKGMDKDNDNYRVGDKDMGDNDIDRVGDKESH